MLRLHRSLVSAHLAGGEFSPTSSLITEYLGGLQISWIPRISRLSPNVRVVRNRVCERIDDYIEHFASIRKRHSRAAAGVRACAPETERNGRCGRRGPREVVNRALFALPLPRHRTYRESSRVDRSNTGRASRLGNPRWRFVRLGDDRRARSAIFSPG